MEWAKAITERAQMVMGVDLAYGPSPAEAAYKHWRMVEEVSRSRTPKRLRKHVPWNGIHQAAMFRERAAKKRHLCHPCKRTFACIGEGVCDARICPDCLIRNGASVVKITLRLEQIQHGTNPPATGDMESEAIPT